MSDHQAKHWCFTINNYDEETIEDLFESWKEKTSYLIFGLEISSSGTPHVQGYLSLKERKRLSFLKEMSAVAHWEISRGTPKQASEYCKKEGRFIEWGELPITAGAIRGAQLKEDWQSIHQLAKSGNLNEFMEKHPQQAFLNLNKFHDLVKHYRGVPQDNPVLENYWYVGDSGTGKSRSARRDFGSSLYLKPTGTKWWPNYNGEENVLIDDVGKEMGYVVEWLKNWGDHYPFQAENKGTHTGMIRPKRIIVTSQYHWEEIVTDPQLRQAIARRFKIKRFGRGLGEHPNGWSVPSPAAHQIHWLDAALNLETTETQDTEILSQTMMNLQTRELVSYGGTELLNESRSNQENGAPETIDEDEYFRGEWHQSAQIPPQDEVSLCSCFEDGRMEEMVIDLTED